MFFAHSALLLIMSLSLTAAASLDLRSVQFTDTHHGVLTSSGSGARFKAGAGTDTFCLYGGPGSALGKFQRDDFTPLSIDDLRTEPTTLANESDGWILEDATDQEVRWQQSTFNMENLNSNGPGNQGMWVGTSAAQAGWANAPGYGNSWNGLLEWRTNDLDPTVAQTVTLDFFYNLDSEFNFDFFEVEYDSAGSTVIVLSTSGTTADSGGTFSAPGAVANLSAPYLANSYPDDQIVLRMAGRSDGGYSDEDGIIDTNGLVQVDDITVGWENAAKAPTSDTDRFEGSDTGPNWAPIKPIFAGFFGRVFPRVEDQDPCRENPTPVFAFIDDGTPPTNPDYTGTGTGGTTSPNWNYGVPGGWVVNYNGGLSNNVLNLENRIWTPPVAWDLPGSADDAPDIQGAMMRFSVWRHLPLLNGFFYAWEVRGRDSVTQQWGGWVSRTFVYYGGGATGDWLNVQVQVSDLVTTPNGPDGVQMSLLCLDAATVFAFHGADSTPSPYFDNLSLFKFRVDGPTITARTIDLFNDSFSQSGLSAHATLAERDALDVRIDMARAIDVGNSSVSGDSMVIDITSVLPGSTIAASDITMSWALHTNPYFEDSLRGNLTGGGGPSGSYTESAGTGYNGWDVWTGAEGPEGGAEVANERYAFDLPDEDFMYPGDILEWYVSATDNGGATGGTPLTTTFPASTTGFNDGDKHSYSRLFSPRALPTITQGGQPDLLLVNAFGHRGGMNDYLSAFGQIGYQEGATGAGGTTQADYDIYTVTGPSSAQDNGIGSNGRHGANGTQLADYSCILQTSGNLTPFANFNYTDNEDVITLTDWHNQPAERFAAYFGDDVTTSTQPNFLTYLSGVMGVTHLGGDVKSEINGVASPLVRPTSGGTSAGFTADWVAYGGCLGINDFDAIGPLSATANNYTTHEFVGNMGVVASSSAGVVFDRLEGGFRKANVTFPFGLVYVYNGGSTGAGGGFSDRAVLLTELLEFFGRTTNPGDAVSVAVPAASLSDPSAHPNPFNPRTELQFSLGSAGPVVLHIYNIAGRRVRTLLDGEVMSPGPNQVTWDGADGDGVPVASGVYVARVSANGFTKHVKVAMVK